jgi:acetylornithine deacetylase/succinyl-diaminopimelate desuccinylase-like protein
MQFQHATLENQWDLSLNIGRIEGGKAGNLVADSAHALLDFRFSEKHSVDQIQAMILGALKHCTVEFTGYGEAVRVDEQSTVYQMFANALEQQGGQSKGISEHGTSDARWFMKYGTVLLIAIPLCSPFHVVDEWVSIESLGRLYLAFEQFCLQYLGGSAQQQITEMNAAA